MKATERNKEAYEFMIWISQNAVKTEQLAKDIQEAKDVLQKKGTNITKEDAPVLYKDSKKWELCLRLLLLEYIEVVAGSSALGLNDFLTVTNEGWKFCERYELYKERKLTNRILWVIVIPSAAYYSVELLKPFVRFIISICRGQNCH